MLLVSTDEIDGDVFNRTVLLLLHYDENGAMGIVVNRPTDIPPAEVVTHADEFAGYSGKLYWGGPVQMDNLWALMRSDDPPEGANAIIDSVHAVSVDLALETMPADPTEVRFYIGYSGWSAGQLDRELARGSWRIVPATSEDVFTDDPQALWIKLRPSPENYRVRLGAREKGVEPQFPTYPEIAVRPSF